MEKHRFNYGNSEMMCNMMMCAMRNIMLFDAFLYCHSGK